MHFPDLWHPGAGITHSSGCLHTLASDLGISDHFWFMLLVLQRESGGVAHEADD